MIRHFLYDVDISLMMVAIPSIEQKLWENVFCKDLERKMVEVGGLLKFIIMHAVIISTLPSEYCN